MPLYPEKRASKRKMPEASGDAVHQWMSVLAEQLDLRCVAMGPGCRNPDTDLDLNAARIAEIDLFGVGDRIESTRLGGFTACSAHCFQGRRLVLAAVNGPYRMAEFIAYASNGALCNIEHFPALLLPSTARTRALAAAFRGRAVEARNGVPVTADWLAKRKPSAVSAIAALIHEVGAAF